MTAGSNQRLVRVIKQAVGQETRSAAKIEYVLGKVAVANGNYADIYLDGNEVTASQGFRVPAWLHVNVGDPVLVAVDYGSNLGKWISEVLPVNVFPKIVVNPNTGSIFTGDGSAAPTTPFSAGGKRFAFFVG